VLPAMSDILLGTCGWSYAEWEGILYPYAQNKLKQYSSMFPTAEIDSTFYRLPKEGMVLGWARNTPREFVFSAKLPRRITHKKAIGRDGSIEDGVIDNCQYLYPHTVISTCTDVQEYHKQNYIQE